VSDRAPSALTIRLFGPFEVRVNGAPLPRVRTRKGQWLLALLALRHGCEVDRAWLAGLLWPESSESAALAALRNSLTDLRRALGQQADRVRSPAFHTLSLDLMDAEVDVVSFDTAIGRDDACSLETAIALYRGPLLEGCAEEWALPERQAREDAYLAALETLGVQAEARGDPQAAVRHLRLVVAVDPAREPAQRALMQAMAASHSYGAAVEVYRDLRLYLHRELNAEPDAATKALFEQIRAEARQKAEGGRQKAEDRREPPVPLPPTHSGRLPSAFCLPPSASEAVGGAVPLD
jgi:DNA-binding SARP family transcriptional activator